MYSLSFVVVPTNSAIEQISRIERVHSSHFIHRDIKPTNFLIGVGPHRNDVYIIDFGLAKRYRDTTTHLHIPFQKHHSFITGTTSYASLNSHLGAEQSRRDDLEALAYVLIYLLCGSLPWYGAKASTQKQRDKIAQMKLDGFSSLLTEWPNEFHVFLDYARALRFEEKPDYAYLRRLFHDLRMRERLENDNTFDWCLPRPSLDVDSHQIPHYFQS
jgi:casein kinase I homolog HRR25